MSSASAYLGNAVTSLREFSSLDVLIIAAVLVACFLYTIRFGKESIISAILALYIALLAFIHFPYKEQLLSFSESDIQRVAVGVGMFVAFVVLGFITVSPLLRGRFFDQGKRRYFDAALLSAAMTALLIAFSYHVLPITSIFTFGDRVAELFAPSQFFFWWLIAPLALLFIVSRR